MPSSSASTGSTQAIIPTWVTLNQGARMMYTAHPSSHAALSDAARAVPVAAT